MRLKNIKVVLIKQVGLVRLGPFDPETMADRISAISRVLAALTCRIDRAASPS
jgi:hypothetical protein